MSRFFYYLILVAMISNIISPVPRVLLSESKNGAIVAMICAIIVGLVITYIIVTIMNQFPGQGLPELLKKYTPKWFYYPILFLLSVIWYIAGLITLISFTYMLLRFLQPYMSIYLTLSSFLIIAIFGAMLKTRSVAVSTEIIFILTVPILFFLLIKTYTSPAINIDFIKIALMHTKHFPSYDAFSTSLYTFMGVFNIVIFNRYFTKKQTFGLKQLLIIGITGVFILITTYLIPIGLNGFDEIDRLVYPWISTSDTIRMEFGVIERAIFIFLISFLAISLINTVIHWHVAIQLLQSIISFKRFKWKETNLTPHLFITFFVAASILITRQLTEYELHKYGDIFFKLLPIAYLLAIFSLIAIKRGAKHND